MQLQYEVLVNAESREFVADSSLREWVCLTTLHNSLMGFVVEKRHFPCSLHGMKEISIQKRDTGFSFARHVPVSTVTLAYEGSTVEMKWNVNAKYPT